MNLCLWLQRPSNGLQRLVEGQQQATKEAARAALADLLHQRVFNQPISADEGKNFNDYTTAEGFIQSIQREHESDGMPESLAASMIWDALYEAIRTLKVEVD